MAKRTGSVKAVTERPDPAAARARRLAEALRQNLRRRKAQARDAAGTAGSEAAPAPKIEGDE